MGAAGWARMVLRTLLLATLAAALLTPAAMAHTAVSSADGKVRASVGLLDEPVSTYAVTGLDVCFTQETTASPRPAVNVANAGNFVATLRAPDGSQHTADLEVPFGRPNCLTFAEPLVLTQPGQYVVDLTGSINGTTFTATGVKAGGAVLDRAAITFPDEDVPSDQELAQRIAALQARVEALEANAQAAADEGQFAPGAPAALLLVALAAVAALRRRAP